MINQEKRDALYGYLKKNGIDCRINYDVLLHVVRKQYRHDCAISEKIHKQVIHLPFFAKIKYREIDSIARLIDNFL